MPEKEKLEKLMEEEELELDEESIQGIKRDLRVVEEELDNVSDFQWEYSKKLLRFGWAAWIFGISAFVASIIIYEGPGLIMNAPALSLSLLVGAGAAPIIVTIILIQRNRRRMERLGMIRDGLITQYKKTLLKKVEENIY